MDFLREFWYFIANRKKFWLIPMVTVLVVIGSLIMLAKGSAVAPFVYTLF